MIIGATPTIHLVAFLASTDRVPWNQSILLRLSVAGRDLDAWDATRFGAHYLIAEIDGQLLIISVAASEPANTLYSLQLVER